MAKRVSNEEKLEKIHNFFIKHPTFYSMKEIDKKLSKETGISGMQIGDLLKSAIDENLVCVEKAGGSNVYWMFKNAGYHHHQCEIEKGRAAIEGFIANNSRKRAQLAKIQELKKVTAAGLELRKQYEVLREQAKEIEDTASKINMYSVDAYKAMKEEYKKYKEDINNITDNIYALKAFIVKKFNIDRREFDRNFNIDENMDYIE